MPSTASDIAPGVRIWTAWVLLLVLGLVVAGLPALAWMARQLLQGLGL